MSWLDSLSATDMAELQELAANLGRPAFEAYLATSLRIRVGGAVPGDEWLDDWVMRWGPDVWELIGERFECGPDDRMYLRGEAPTGEVQS